MFVAASHNVLGNHPLFDSVVGVWEEGSGAQVKDVGVSLPFGGLSRFFLTNSRVRLASRPPSGLTVGRLL